MAKGEIDRHFLVTVYTFKLTASVYMWEKDKNVLAFLKYVFDLDVTIPQCRNQKCLAKKVLLNTDNIGFNSVTNFDMVCR